MRTLTIDARKLHDSGIGRYLRNLLPGLPARLTVDRLQILTAPDDADEVTRLVDGAGARGRIAVLPVQARPHTLAEQRLAFARQVRGSALWVPHYNLPLLHRGPLVVTLHDLAPIDLPDSFGRGAASLGKRALGRLLLQTAVQRAEAILTVSTFTQERLVTLLGAKRNRVHVTPLAVDAAWPALAVAPPAHREGEDQPYLLFVGNLKPNKNLSLLLEALLLLRRQGRPGPRLLVVGKVSGFLTADRESASRALSLGDGVRMLGAVRDDVLIGLYRGALATVMPSRYEGFGLPLLEAMRYGCPVLSSNAASLPEAAGGAALLFSPDDAPALAKAITAVRDPETANRLRVAGFARESSMTWNGAVERTADVLNLAVRNA